MMDKPTIFHGAIGNWLWGLSLFYRRGLKGHITQGKPEAAGSTVSKMQPEPGIAAGVAGQTTENETLDKSLFGPGDRKKTLNMPAAKQPVVDHCRSANLNKGGEVKSLPHKPSRYDKEIGCPAADKIVTGENTTGEVASGYDGVWFPWPQRKPNWTQVRTCCSPSRADLLST